MLQNLPVELLDSTLSYLDKPALRAVTTLSHDLRTKTEPLLYREYSWQRKEKASSLPGSASPSLLYKPGDSADGEADKHSVNGDHTIHLLIRTLLGRPELGAYIRRIYFRHPEEFFIRTHKPWLGYCKAELNRTTKVTRLIRLGKRSTQNEIITQEFWATQVQQGNIGALLGFLLLHAPFLQELDVDVHFKSRNRFIDQALQHGQAISSTQLSRFQYLRDVNLRPVPFRVGNGFADDYGTLGPRWGKLLLQLPAMESICLWSFGSQGDCHAFQSILTVTADKLKTMRLLKSDLAGDHLEALLSATPNIRKLEIELYSDQLAESLYQLRLKAALDRVRTNLRELRVARIGPLLRRFAPFPPESLGSFKSFEGLEIFHVPFTLLLGLESPSAPALTEILPQNLIHFELRVDIDVFSATQWSTESLLSYMQAFITAHKSCTPNLKSVHLRLSKFQLSAFNDPDWEESAECSKGYGLEFKVL